MSISGAAISYPMQHFIMRAQPASRAAAPEGNPSAPASSGIPAATLTPLATNPGMLKRDPPEVEQAALDQQAAAFLRMNELPEGPPDNAPENIYARVIVEGKVVATLYNSGCAESTFAAARAYDWAAEPSIAGPDLARLRAQGIADALGGTVEMADTAKTQAEWQPRESVQRTYTRAELDRAIEAMRKLSQQAVAQRQAAHGGSPAANGTSLNL